MVSKYINYSINLKNNFINKIESSITWIYISLSCIYTYFRNTTYEDAPGLHVSISI